MTVLIHTLLKYAASAPGSRPVLDMKRALEQADEAELRWALDAGLGPWLSFAAGDFRLELPPAVGQQLLGAELTARLQSALRTEVAAEVIDCCLAIGAPVTLLKGISIGGQHYPAVHLRTMTDVDLLVPPGAFEVVERELLRRGYRHGPDTLGDDAHHGVPLIDPAHGVWVELHHALFPARSPLVRNRAFAAARIPDRSVATSFHGRPVLRFSDEMQLAYIAAFWARDLCTHRIDPSFVTPLLDATCLLQSTRNTMDWARVNDCLDDDLATASLCLLADYVTKRGLGHIPLEVVQRLRTTQAIVSTPELALLSALLDRYLLRGRPFRLFNSWHLWDNLMTPGSHTAKLCALPWRIAFPPSYPHRYSPREQLARLRRLMGRVF